MSRKYVFNLHNGGKDIGEIIVTADNRQEAMRLAREFGDTWDEVEVREVGQRGRQPWFKVSKKRA